MISTKPYLFSSLDQTGVSYAKELKVKGAVIGIDVTMEQINSFLRRQKFDAESEVFIADHTGKKIASSKFKNKKQVINSGFTSNKEISFSLEEKKYIENHATLIVSNENDWAPFDFQIAGEPMGYSIDLLKLISLKSGLKFKFSNGYQWAEIMDMFNNKDIDIVHSLSNNIKLKEKGSFSKPIYTLKNYYYFIIAKGTKEIKQIDELQNKTVAVLKGGAVSSYMKENYPNIELLETDNTANALLAVSRGIADVMIDTKESYQYNFPQLFIENLKISGWFKKFDHEQANNIHIMVQKNNPVLLSIINKTLSSLTPKELNIIHKKWFKTLDESTQTKRLNQVLENALLNNKTDKIIFFKENNTHYFAILADGHYKNIFLGIKINADRLLKAHKDNLHYSLLIAFVLLLLFLPLILYSTNLIVKPIKALILENDKIRNRKFNTVKNIKTNIVEFNELSKSLVLMSKSVHDYQLSQEKIFDAIVKLIAEAIDAKSTYTGGHCKRVPEVAKRLLAQASNSKEDAFKDFSLTSKDALREFEIGAWLHDCGKVTTPEYVVDKATKLETIYNRIHEIRMRFEVLWRDAEIEHLKGKLSAQALQLKQKQLQDDYEFIASANIGGEFMDKNEQDRVKAIAQTMWQRNFNDRLGLCEAELLRYEGLENERLPVMENLLSDKKHHIIARENFDHKAYKDEGFKEKIPDALYNYGEIYNLCIAKGTLSPEERYKINEHVIMSIKMLEKIPFPPHLSNIPEFAGTHHETLIGTGYPRKLSKDELSIPARIMSIADIFEALTASDRPYKKAKTLSQAIKIISFMVKDHHIDEDLFKLFISSGAHLDYARKYLKPEQIDDVDIEQYI